MVSKRSSGSCTTVSSQRLSRHTVGQTTYQIRLPQILAHAKQLIRRRAAHNKVLGKVNAPDAVEAADEGRARLGVQAGDNGADKVRAEAPLVQRAADEVGKGARRDRPLLAQAVHIGLVAEEVRDGGHIRREPREPEEHVVAVLEDLGEVVGHGERLHAQAQIAGDGHAVFADHGDTGAAVY